MELKHLTDGQTIIIRNLLIVPYGIETKRLQKNQVK